MGIDEHKEHLFMDFRKEVNQLLSDYEKKISELIEKINLNSGLPAYVIQNIYN